MTRTQLTLWTRVFDLADEYGYDTDTKLAAAMQISGSTLSRVRNGFTQINNAFITGATLAFPDKSFNELFFVITETETDEETVAAPAFIH